jgi:hypothetical protein
MLSVREIFPIADLDVEFGILQDFDGKMSFFCGHITA